MEFNPVEIFKIAQKLEEDGITFYKKAADYSENKEHKTLFNELGNMELEHFKTFAHLEKVFTPEGYADSAEIKKYIGEKFGAKIYDLDSGAKVGKKLKSIGDILDYALSSENLAVEYYSQMKRSLTQPDTQSALSKIIEEEKKHIIVIEDAIYKLKR